MAKNEKAVASVLAFEKKLVPSDGYFYGLYGISGGKLNYFLLVNIHHLS